MNPLETTMDNKRLKRSVAGLVFVLGGILGLAPAMLHAEQNIDKTIDKMYVGGDIGLAMPRDLHAVFYDRRQSPDPISHTPDVDNGILAGLNIGYRRYLFQERLPIRIEAEYFYRKHNINSFSLGANTSNVSGDLKGHHTFINLYIDLDPQPFYVGAGAGAIRNTVISNEWQDYLLGFQYMVGYDYKLNEDCYIGIKIRYVKTRDSLKESVGEVLRESGAMPDSSVSFDNMDFWGVTANLKLF